MHINLPYGVLLLASLLLSTVGIAQVGINQPNPEQALDVNGKVKVADDSTPPSEGTLRYNDGAADLEGYVDGEWKSLTKSATADSPQPVVFAHFGVQNDEAWVPFDRTYDYTRADPTSDITNVEVPAGKILVVDQICVTQDGGSNDSYFLASVRPTRPGSDGSQFIRNPQIRIGGSRRAGTTCVEAERAPLLVVKDQGSIQAWNSTDSGGPVRIVVFGFYVDNLDQYFGY